MQQQGHLLAQILSGPHIQHNLLFGLNLLAERDDTARYAYPPALDKMISFSP